MSITEDTANQPAAKTWTTAWTSAQTTASFTVGAGTLICALLAASGGSPSLTVTGSITDSLSGGWTLLKRQNTAGTNIGGTAEVWVRNGGGTGTAAPGAMTVSATVATGTGGTGGQLKVMCLLGADITANQNGATGGVSNNNAAVMQVSVAAGTGGKIYGAALNWTNSTVMTVLANTTAIAQFSDTTNGDTWEAFRSAGDTAGTATYGYSTSTRGHLAAAEIKAGAAAAATGRAAYAQPGKTWLRRFHHRQAPQSFPAAVTAAQAGPPVYPLGHPVMARQQPQQGGRAVRRAGSRAQAGAPVRALAQAVTARLRVLPLRGRAAGHGGVFASLGAPLKALAAPVQARRLPARGGSAAWRAGTYTAVVTGSGPPVYPLHGPVQARRQPLRGGSTSRRAGTYAQPGPPVRPLPGPVEARQPLPPRGRTASRAGTFTLVVTGSGPPVYPLGHPVQARRQPAQGGRVIRRAGTYAGSGPPVKPLQQPIGIYRRQPPPPTRGRTASQRGPYAQAGPPVVRLHRPVRGQPAVPLLTGRADWRAGLAVFVPPPPFTIGALTATDAGQASLTAAGASSALTAGTAPAGGTLTAADQRTGGPG